MRFLEEPERSGLSQCSLESESLVLASLYQMSTVGPGRAKESTRREVFASVNRYR